jgi:membrane-associated protease RseP (regulator of RpoE activity)
MTRQNLAGTDPRLRGLVVALILVLLSILALVLVPQRARGQEGRKDEQGTYLGALFSPVEPRPVPATPAGVLITHVLPGSPAAKAGLRRNDVLLQYGPDKVRDCAHLAQLIRNDKPDHKVKLLVRRDGREVAAEATLALGLALKVAPNPYPAGAPGKDGKGVKGAPASGVSEPTAAGTVSVFATPLERGKMKLTIEYYCDGRLQSVTCRSAADIANTVEKLPERERALVRVALQRLRTLNAPPAPDAMPRR